MLFARNITIWFKKVLKTTSGGRFVQNGHIRVFSR